MQGIKGFSNGVIHPVDTICYFLKGTIINSRYIFIITCLMGLLLYTAKIKKGRDIAVGSVIIYAVLRVVAACL